MALATVDHRHQLTAGNPAAHDVGAGPAVLIDDIPRQAAARFGGKSAIIDGDRILDYASLDRRVDAAAAFIRSLGLSSGQTITLYGENSLEWIVAYYAIARAGCVINPVNALLTPTELAFIVKDCEAQLTIAATTTGLTDLAVPLLTFDALWSASYDGRGDGQLAAAADRYSVSTICYTSGTTGRPKGALLSHRNVVTNVQLTATMHGRRDRDIVVSALSFAHVYGNVVMNASLLSGATLVLFARFAAPRIVDALVQHRATVLEGVPTMYHYLLDYPPFRTADLSYLRLCTVGGQTMGIEAMQAVEAIVRCPLIELWGMTELGGLGTTHSHLVPTRHGSIGVALPGVETKIVTLEDAAVTAGTGEPGELLVRGPTVMLGYRGHPEATAAAITADGWLRSGDVATRDADGYLYIVDRKSDMILTAGYNIYPAELERVIGAHPAVSMAAIGPVPDAVKGEIARAYIVLHDGAAATADELMSHCREYLAAYKVPRSIMFVNDLPKTGSGKIMRRELHMLDEQAAST